MKNIENTSFGNSLNDIPNLTMTKKTFYGLKKIEAFILFCIILSGFYFINTTQRQSSLILSEIIEEKTIQEKWESDFRFVFWMFNVFVLIITFFILPKKKISIFGMTFMYKLLQSFAIVYAINILLWALMTPEMLQSYLKVLDPSLKNQTYEERDFSIDCRLYTPENPTSKFANLMETIDVFVLGHLIGWLVKSLIFRNNIMSWTMSIMFEIHELSLKHWLPNFNECWWDHLLLDLFGMNLLGILVGNYVQHYLKLERFHWFFDPTDKSEKLTYFQRFIYSFTHVKEYVSNHKWHFLARPKSFLAVTYVMFLGSVVDLNWFFLKNSLGLNPSQFFMGMRVWIVGWYSLIVMYDFHKWLKRTGKKRRISINVVIGHIILILEAIVFWKNKRDDFFEETTPLRIKLVWGGFSCIFLLGLYSSYCYGKKKFIKTNNE
jgi:phosphatidylserine synthase 2